MSIQSRLDKAAVQVVLRMPFYGSLLSCMKLQIDDSIPTACTDGRRIRFSPAFVDTLTDSQLVGLMMHETLHPAMDHISRRGHRDPHRWNIAADYEVNHIIEDYRGHLERTLKRSSSFELPPCPLLDRSISTGRAVEAIYDLLPPPKGGEGEGQASSPGMMDDPDGVAADREAARQEWQRRVVQAAMAEKQATQGKLPASLERLIGEITAPKVRWQEVMREWARQFVRDDYSWSRPNPRYAGSGFILPSLAGERMGAVVVAIDSSGSIDSELLREFLGEIQGIMDQCRPSKVHVLDCDTRVHQCVEFELGDDLRSFSPKGGGGTDFAPVFAEVERLGIEAVGLVYLTDLYGSFPSDEPDYPVLWTACGGACHVAPFGRTVSIENAA